MNADHARSLTNLHDRYRDHNPLYAHVIDRIERAANTGLHRLPEPWATEIWDSFAWDERTVAGAVSQLRLNGFKVLATETEILTVSWRPETMEQP